MAVTYLNTATQALYCGNSTDEKPIIRNGDGNEIRVQNGAIFFEMDTSDIYMFDQETNTWFKQENGGGGGGGGTTNYNALSNKPRINGVELRGNKTAAELGLATPLEWNK